MCHPCRAIPSRAKDGCYALHRAGVFRFCERIYLPRLALDGTDRDYVTTTRRHSRDETGVRNDAFRLYGRCFVRGGIISERTNSCSINLARTKLLDLSISCSSILNQVLTVFGERKRNMICFSWYSQHLFIFDRLLAYDEDSTSNNPRFVETQCLE